MKINLKKSLLIGLAIISGYSQADFGQKVKDVIFSIQDYQFADFATRCFNGNLSSNEKAAGIAIGIAAVSLAYLLCASSSDKQTSDRSVQRANPDRVKTKAEIKGLDIARQIEQPALQRTGMSKYPPLPPSPAISRGNSPTPVLAPADQTISYSLYPSVTEHIKKMKQDDAVFNAEWEAENAKLDDQHKDLSSMYGYGIDSSDSDPDDDSDEDLDYRNLTTKRKALRAIYIDQKKTELLLQLKQLEADYRNLNEQFFNI